ncbi:MAG TPA: YkgJ family cysteine cluster protein [Candidatus Sulfomarinibacteraceae bacterium]|nr:YkgJ family cysteine cluster protein [Candidatus Sulfomarinibacteraceae bacterium]
MTERNQSLPRFLEGKRQLATGESFQFTCHPGVPCFNRCCADVNVILTPLDVLGLARRTGLHTRVFLDTYTANPITKDLQLPMVLLKMRDDEGKHCQFLGERGCTVYEDRPWACRMYPLGMAIPPARAGVEPEPIFFVFEDDHCEGRLQDDAVAWKAEAWRADQGLIERDEIEAGFRELVSHPWFIGGRQLDPKRMHMFYTACYDLDTFREFVFESSFLERFELEDDLVHEIRTNDLALLRFAFRWLRFALFKEPTVKVQENAIQRSDP